MVLIIPYLIWMTWAVAIYAVQYDGSVLTFGYLGWKVKFTNSEIISAKSVQIRWLKWRGMGWRIKGFKRLGYITKSGSGVEIKTSRKNRSYTFNCENPESLLYELQSAGVAVESDSAV